MKIVQTKKTVWLFLATLAMTVVSCTSSPAAEAPPVEYGATINEWEEAVQNTSTTEAATAANDEIAIVSTTTPATSASEPTDTDDNNALSTASEETAYREVLWDALIPSDYTPDAIMEKYADQLARIQDGSPEALELYTIMQEEFNNAPINETLDQTYIKIPGFIAPLDYSGEEITEFLLVPYFGACIHVPPPPVNQTVLVKTAAGEGINPIDAYNPIWVTGMITAEGTVTDLAHAGYAMENAATEPYIMQRP